MINIKIYSLVLFLFLGNANAQNADTCASPNGEIQGGASYDATTSFLHTVEHHWKFEFWKGAVCWGRPDDQYQDSDAKKAVSNECAGSLVYKAQKENFHSYEPVKISWGANLSENQVFSVEYTQDITKVSDGSSSSDCTTHNRQTRLDTLKNTFNMRGTLEVPADVWIVAVKAEKGEGHNNDDIIPLIGIRPANSKVLAQNLQKVPDVWHYIYTTPGEKIDILLEDSNQNLDVKKKFNIKYNFFFVGHNRCEELIGAPETVGFEIERNSKSASKTIRYIDNIIQSNLLNGESLDKLTLDQKNTLALRMGCLRNPAYLKAAMKNSGPETLRPVIDYLKSLHEGIYKPTPLDGVATSTNVNERKDKNVKFANYILKTTILDIMRTALSELKAYCEYSPNYTLESAATGEVELLQGIERSTLTYFRIESLLKEIPLDSYEEFLNRLKSWNQQKLMYSDVIRTFDSDHFKALKAYEMAMLKVGLHNFSNIITKLKSLPATSINQVERDALIADLTIAQDQASDLELKIKQYLLSFGRRIHQEVKFEEFEKYYAYLKYNTESLGERLKEHLQWYVENNNDSAFIRDTNQLAIDMMAVKKSLVDTNVSESHVNYFQSLGVDKLYADYIECFNNKVGEK